MNKIILQCEQIDKTFHDGTDTIEVLKQVDLTVREGDTIAIVGPSGSGKSTLLHLLGGLDHASSGEIKLHQRSWQSLSEKMRCRLRNQHLGFIYQFHHLLPEFTALENVAMTLLLARQSAAKAEFEAKKMLEKVGLSHRLQHKPAQLSGGERQRVAIARALVHQPHCVLADEPTGNLDQATAARVFELMLELNRELNTALVIVTHDQQLAVKMNQVLTIQNGCLNADIR